MARSALSRKPTRLSMNERAIVRSLCPAAEGMSHRDHFCEVLDLSPTGLQLLSPEPFTVGEELDISVTLQGRDGACTISGVIRWVSSALDTGSHVVTVEISKGLDGARWRHQFH